MSLTLKKRREINLGSYRDTKYTGSREEQEEKLQKSTTLYVGNLSFYTTEEQIYDLYGRCGEIRRVIMGLDKYKKTPCGFCFVEFHDREDALQAMQWVNGTRLDNRIIRCDWDAGFLDGRQFGRGKSGGQIRDEYRENFDPDRGGYGKIMGKKLDVLDEPA